MEVVPSTTVISTETLSSVATFLIPIAPARLRAGLKSAWYGEWMVNARNELTVGLGPPPGSAGVEWRVSDALVPYEQAVAFMQARAAAIAAGKEPELVWLIEHPPLYTSGTSAKPEELIEARFPVFASGRRGHSQTPESAPRSALPAWRWCRRCKAAGARSARPARALCRRQWPPRAPA